VALVPGATRTAGVASCPRGRSCPAAFDSLAASRFFSFSVSFPVRASSADTAASIARPTCDCIGTRGAPMDLGSGFDAWRSTCGFNMMRAAASGSSQCTCLSSAVLRRGAFTMEPLKAPRKVVVFFPMLAVELRAVLHTESCRFCGVISLLRHTRMAGAHHHTLDIPFDNNSAASGLSSSPFSDDASCVPSYVWPWSMRPSSPQRSSAGVNPSAASRAPERNPLPQTTSAIAIRPSRKLPMLLIPIGHNTTQRASRRHIIETGS